MSQPPSVAFDLVEAESLPPPPAAATATRASQDVANIVLKGTTRGLEILISGSPTTDAMGERLAELLAEAPQFFAGSNARVVFDGALASGSLARLEDVATRFELRIVEISPLLVRRRPELVAEEPVPSLADGSGRVTEEVVDISIAIEPDPAEAAPAEPVVEAIAELEAELLPGPRVVVGPVRSGVIVDHKGHVIVIGDVNPGAEVRAEGSIVVLGWLRGVAHAAIGSDTGCIIALKLQPQQLRIGRMVARAGDADSPSDGAEIAYVTNEAIVVERFLGRLPSGIAASM